MMNKLDVKLEGLTDNAGSLRLLKLGTSLTVGKEDAVLYFRTASQVEIGTAQWTSAIDSLGRPEDLQCTVRTMRFDQDADGAEVPCEIVVRIARGRNATNSMGPSAGVEKEIDAGGWRVQRAQLEMLGEIVLVREFKNAARFQNVVECGVLCCAAHALSWSEW